MEGNVIAAAVGIFFLGWIAGMITGSLFYIAVERAESKGKE